MTEPIIRVDKVYKSHLLGKRAVSLLSPFVVA